MHVALQSCTVSIQQGGMEGYVGNLNTQQKDALKALSARLFQQQGTMDSETMVSDAHADARKQEA